MTTSLGNGMKELSTVMKKKIKKRISHGAASAQEAKDWI